MKHKQPTAEIQIAIALAVDALQLADDGLSAALDALGGAEIETAPVCPFALQGWLATVRHFGQLFDRVKGHRFPMMGTKIRERIEAIGDGPNLPGLRRTLSAVEFSVASLDEASDLAEAEGDDDCLCDSLMTAVSCMGAIAVSLESTLIRPHGGYGMN